MAALYSAEEIIEITGARLAAGMISADAAEICSDTRRMPAGAWFIALPGREFDGHDFLGDAFSQNALGCIVAERPSYPIASTSFPLLAVDDTIEALTKLARNWRRRLNPKVIVVLVNRSVEPCQSGLTCYQGVSARVETEFWQIANQSTGVVLNTVLDLADSTQAVVAELSPTSREHLQTCLTALAPNVLVITQDGFDHLQISLSESEFQATVTALIAALDPRKCKVVVATTSAKIIDRMNEFAGGKSFFQSPPWSAGASPAPKPDSDDADIWAGQTASEQI